MIDTGLRNPDVRYATREEMDRVLASLEACVTGVKRWVHSYLHDFESQEIRRMGQLLGELDERITRVGDHLIQDDNKEYAVGQMFVVIALIEEIWITMNKKGLTQ